jgi:hypothetical protein
MLIYKDVRNIQRLYKRYVAIQSREENNLSELIFPITVAI